MESAIADARQEQAAVQRDPAGFGGKGANQQLDQTLRGDNGDNNPRRAIRAHNPPRRCSDRANPAWPIWLRKFPSRYPPEINPPETQPEPKPQSTPSPADHYALSQPKKSSSGQQPDVNPSPSEQPVNQQTGSQANGASSASGGGAGGKAGASRSGRGESDPHQ